MSVFGLQFAVASGATVIATSSSDKKLEVAKKLGATHLINYKTTPDWDKEVLKITGGRGVDHVVEVGGPGTLSKSLNCVRYGGSVNLIGFVAGVSRLIYMQQHTPLYSFAHSTLTQAPHRHSSMERV